MNETESMRKKAIVLSDDELEKVAAGTDTDSLSYTSHMAWYAYTDCENGDTSGNMKLL